SAEPIALLAQAAAGYVDLGITYARAGQLDRALGQFEAGLNLPPPSQPSPDWSGAVAALREAIYTGAASPAPSRAGAVRARADPSPTIATVPRLERRGCGASRGDLDSRCFAPAGGCGRRHLHEC